MCHGNIHGYPHSLTARLVYTTAQRNLAMDVTFMCSGEEPLTMEVGFFDTVEDIKQRLQSRRGWPAGSTSLHHNGDVLDLDVHASGIVEGSVIHVTLLDSWREQRQHKAKGQKLSNTGQKHVGAQLRVTVVSRCGTRRLEVAVGARAAVSALRAELERGRGARFPLPREGGYFFIHRQSVMDEAQSFELHGVATGDEVVVFDGSVTRGPAY